MINLCSGFNTRTFSEIYEDVDDFVSDYNSIGIPATIDVSTVNALYYMLMAKYASNAIINSSEAQFKYKLFLIIFEYGPTWEKKLDIQEKLRQLTDADIEKGTQAIYNTAMNPDGTPATDALTPLNYINSQNTTNYKKSKMDSYTQLWGLLATDVTEEFLSKFKVLFNPFAVGVHPTYFVTEEDEEEEE